MSLTSLGLLTLDGTAAGIDFNSRTAASTDTWTAYSTGATGTADLFFDYNGATMFSCSQTGQVDIKGSSACVILSDRADNADPDWVIFNDAAILNFAYDGSNVVRSFSATIQGLGNPVANYTSQVLRCANSSGDGAINLYNTTAKVGLYYYSTPDRLYACNTGVAGTTACYIAANGTAWLVPSDRRLKNTIIPLPATLNKILALNPVSYMWNDPENDNTEYGLIAQEVLEILPEVVDKPKDPEEMMYGINYTTLIPFLIKAVQEQHQLVKQQEVLIKSLTDRIEILECK